MPIQLIINIEETVTCKKSTATILFASPIIKALVVKKSITINEIIDVIVNNDYILYQHTQSISMYLLAPHISDRLQRSPLSC